MTYPGNSALARETQARILETFSQTLELARQGRLQEAALGCDFILKMDRQFELAKTLQSRLQGAEGPVEVSDLALEPTEPEPGPTPAPMAADTQPQPKLTPTAPADLDDSPLLLDLDSDELPSLDDLDSLGLDLDAPLSDPPAASPAAGPPGSPPGASTAPASDGRISELLAEGRQAHAAGDYQAAIDAWSRIFLLDIDHAEATQLIENARKLKAEQERKIDELMHEATGLRDLGQKEKARAAFERVLELHPSHLAAREYIAQLDSPDMPAAPPPGYPPSDASPVPEDGGGLYTGPPEDSGDPPAAGPISFKQPAPVATATGASKPDRSFLRIGLGVFALLLVVGFLVYSNWGRLFPNASEEPPAPGPNVIQQATRLQIDGKTEEALALLQGLPADHPLHDRAQLLIERWGGAEIGEEEEEMADTALPEERRLERLAQIERARRLYDEREYLEAARAFQVAEKIDPLEGAVADLYDDTKRQLLPIAPQITLFRQREWELLLPTLWRRLQEEPTNRDAKRILANCYFNLGVRDLRRGNAEEAREYLKEMVQLVDDPLGQRLLLFSESYSQYPEDLLYRIYVSKLSYRQ